MALALADHLKGVGLAFHPVNTKNGFVGGKTLFMSTDDDKNGLDSVKLKQTANAINELLE